ncbi:MAG: protein disulfide oxidoreductase [Methylomonas sp.]|jgi:thiol-disulfide isomerase/thioredoxin
MKKFGFYLLAACFIFAGQFLRDSDLVTGKPPDIAQPTLSNLPAIALVSRGPAVIYFWAEWCGICAMMQNSMTALAADYPQLTIALRSGADNKVENYLQQHHLAWPVVNDEHGAIARRFGVNAVPAVFIVDNDGEIVFTSIGYSTEWGLRLRLRLAEFF